MQSGKSKMIYINIISPWFESTGQIAKTTYLYCQNYSRCFFIVL